MIKNDIRSISAVATVPVLWFWLQAVNVTFWGTLIICGIMMLITTLWWLCDSGLTPHYVFRNQHQRDLTKLVKGVVVMGPEGMNRMGLNDWETKRGGIRIKTAKQNRNSENTKVELHIGDQVFYESSDLYYRDFMRLRAALDNWEAAHTVDERLARIRNKVDAAYDHVAEHREELDQLDREVVKARSLPPKQRIAA